jgi:serine/threonine protein kinase
MIGKIINKYKITQELGRGGMASVYLGEHMEIQDRVAIKVLNKEWLSNKNIKSRFLKEAHDMAKMSHYGIVKVHDTIEGKDIIAFLMEYVEGETLKNHIERKGSLNNDDIKKIIKQIVEAVVYVHSQGIVHRDIKPSNLMITSEGKIKLMDFGIAKTMDAVSPEYTQTNTGVQIGTPMYMSPEQVRANGNISYGSDIFSLGVVLWQLVTSKKPYSEKTLATIDIQFKIINEKLPLTNTVWDIIIQKATEKEPEMRYHQVVSLLKAIDGLSFTKKVVNKEVKIESPVLDEVTILESSKQSRPRSQQPKSKATHYKPRSTKTEEEFSFFDRAGGFFSLLWDKFTLLIGIIIWILLLKNCFGN